MKHIIYFGLKTCDSDGYFLDHVIRKGITIFDSRKTIIGVPNLPDDIAHRLIKYFRRYPNKSTVTLAGGYSFVIAESAASFNPCSWGDPRCTNQTQGQGMSIGITGRLSTPDGATYSNITIMYGLTVCEMIYEGGNTYQCYEFKQYDHPTLRFGRACVYFLNYIAKHPEDDLVVDAEDKGGIFVFKRYRNHDSTAHHLSPSTPSPPKTPKILKTPSPVRVVSPSFASRSSTASPSPSPIGTNPLEILFKKAATNRPSQVSNAQRQRPPKYLGMNINTKAGGSVKLNINAIEFDDRVTFFMALANTLFDYIPIVPNVDMDFDNPDREWYAQYEHELVFTMRRLMRDPVRIFGFEQPSEGGYEDFILRVRRTTSGIQIIRLCFGSISPTQQKTYLRSPLNVMLTPEESKKAFYFSDIIKTLKQKAQKGDKQSKMLLFDIVLQIAITDGGCTGTWYTDKGWRHDNYQFAYQYKPEYKKLTRALFEGVRALTTELR